MYIQEPDRGALNAGIAGVHDAFNGSAGVLSRRGPVVERPDRDAEGRADAAEDDPARPDGAARPDADPRRRGARRARSRRQRRRHRSTQIAGVVWRDFKPGGGTPGKVETEELGLPGVTVAAARLGRQGGRETTSGDDGAFTFDDVQPGDYRVGDRRRDVREAVRRRPWLGPKLITPAIMIAYIWIWAGFAMVVIAAGLAAIRATCSRRRAPTAAASGRSSAASPCRCSRRC